MNLKEFFPKNLLAKGENKTQKFSNDQTMIYPIQKRLYYRVTNMFCIGRMHNNLIITNQTKPIIANMERNLAIPTVIPRSFPFI